MTWSGRGWAVPLLTFLAVLAVEVAVEAATGDPELYQTAGWPLGLGLTLGGVLVGAVARRSPDVPDRTLVDTLTGEPVRVDGVRHSFMFVPLRWWPHVLLVAGAVVPLARLG